MRTVKELIEALAAYDPTALVCVQDEREMRTLHEIESFGYVPTREGKTLAINASYCDDKANDPEERYIL